MFYDFAKTARSICPVCGKNIAVGDMRFYVKLQPGDAPKFSRYHHMQCLKSLPEATRDHDLAVLTKWLLEAPDNNTELRDLLCEALACRQGGGSTSAGSSTDPT